MVRRRVQRCNSFRRFVVVGCERWLILSEHGGKTGLPYKQVRIPLRF